MKFRTKFRTFIEFCAKIDCFFIKSRLIVSYQKLLKTLFKIKKTRILRVLMAN
jgi:hypothetical protein